MSMFDSAKVLYKLVDPSIAADTRTDTPSSSSAFSDTANLDNLLNKKKGAYLEKDYFVLDGTHTFLTAGDDVGWESENFSNNVDSEVSNSLLTITDSSENNLIALKEIVGNTVGATSITSPIGLTVCGKNLYNNLSSNERNRNINILQETEYPMFSKSSITWDDTEFIPFTFSITMNFGCTIDTTLT